MQQQSALELTAHTIYHSKLKTTITLAHWRIKKAVATMDLAQLRALLKEEMAAVKEALTHEMANIAQAMVLQNEDLKASVRDELCEMRRENAHMKASVDQQFTTVHEIFKLVNIEPKSATSTRTSQQAFSALSSESAQRLPDAARGIDIDAWNADANAPGWALAPGVNESFSSGARVEAYKQQPAEPDKVFQGDRRKMCLLCHGDFKHKR
jgi:hypothetical protein